MTLPFILGLSIAAMVIMTAAAIRLYLQKQSRKLVERIKAIPPYSSTKDGLSAPHQNLISTDIRTDLECSFCGQIISNQEERCFSDHYRDVYQDTHSLLKRLKTFGIGFSDVHLNFILDFEFLPTQIKRHNEQIIQEQLDTHKDFFDHCLKYPLDRQQRRSIVSEEDNCLVVSSAGSGKTSSIVGKVKYLTEIKGIDPRKILLISYTNKAAAELTERMNTDGLKGYTFHKLAIDLIGKVTGIKPSICDNTDALFIETYHSLAESKVFKKNMVAYFVDYLTSETDWEQRKNERREQLAEQKNIQLKSIFPDMDGRTIYVRSEQENKICFTLSSLGVKFRYEEPYEHQVADEMHAQYRPDFSIYYEQDGVTRRIYLEHFGVDEHSLVPDWFAKDKNMAYEEANQKYNDGITWKKAVHEKFGTHLLVTSSADFQYLDIKDKLKKLLKEAGVPFQEKTDEELYDLLLPKGCKQEKAFIRLVATFVTLAKSSCKSVADILREAEKEQDERSAFIIEHIFRPVYERYAKALSDRNQIDFTDAILQATEICRTSHPVEFEYIIVDEFQDISVDRYQFLKVLRAGTRPAKLYCVGNNVFVFIII